MVDIGWEGIPNWIQAGTAVLTLGAAVLAGVYARSAAHWTKEQANASNEQVRIARDALEVAQSEALSSQSAAERQRQESESSYRRFAESRLDDLAPTIYATAQRRASQLLEVRRRIANNDWTYWQPLEAPESFEEGQNMDVQFRVQLDVCFRNVSDRIARVEVIDPGFGEVDLPSGRPIVLLPYEEQTLMWSRRLTPLMLSTQTEIDDPRNWLFPLTLWVRDLGMNVQDTYKFNGDLRLFARDGSRLIVRPAPEHIWDIDVAIPLRERVYERLVAEDLEKDAGS